MSGTNFSIRKPVDHRTMGIEIECQVFGKVDMERYIGFFYSTYDGSLNYTRDHTAVEFVSQPLVTNWLRKEINRLWKRHEWTFDNSCGIHIHVSRQWLSMKRAALINTFLFSLSKYDREAAFGRKESYFCGYRPTLDSYERYRAINIRNEKTIEFRIFSGGDAKWAVYCTLVVQYLVENATRLNYDSFMAFVSLHNPGCEHHGGCDY